MGKVILELTTEQLNQLQACVMDARLYYKLEARQDQRDAGMKITEVEDWESRCKESAARHLVEADQATALLEYLRDGWRFKAEEDPVFCDSPKKGCVDHGADESAAPAEDAPERHTEDRGLGLTQIKPEQIMDSLFEDGPKSWRVYDPFKRYTCEEIMKIIETIPPCVLGNPTCTACEWWNSEERREWSRDGANSRLLMEIKASAARLREK